MTDKEQDLYYIAYDPYDHDQVSQGAIIKYKHKITYRRWRWWGRIKIKFYHLTKQHK